MLQLSTLRNTSALDRHGDPAPVRRRYRRRRVLGVYTAWRLAEAGVAVVVFDMGIAGEQPTARSSGGLRLQFASVYEIQLSVTGRRFCERLEHDSDLPGGINRVGYVFLTGPRQHALLHRCYTLQRTNGVPSEWLEPEQVRDLLPYGDLNGVSGGTFTRDDGFVNAWDVHQCVLRRCRKLGVMLRQHNRCGRRVATEPAG